MAYRNVFFRLAQASVLLWTLLLTGVRSDLIADYLVAVTASSTADVAYPVTNVVDGFANSNTARRRLQGPPAGKGGGGGPGPSVDDDGCHKTNAESPAWISVELSQQLPVQTIIVSNNVHTNTDLNGYLSVGDNPDVTLNAQCATVDVSKLIYRDDLTLLYRTQAYTSAPPSFTGRI